MREDDVQPYMSCEGDGDVSDIMPRSLSLPRGELIFSVTLFANRLVLTESGSDNDWDDGRKETI